MRRAFRRSGRCWPWWSAVRCHSCQTRLYRVACDSHVYVLNTHLYDTPPPPLFHTSTSTYLQPRAPTHALIACTPCTPTTRIPVAQLDFQNCAGISDKSCFVIAGAGCTRLRKFDLRLLRKTRPEITSEGVIAVVESCKLSLRTLKLARCTNVDDRALVRHPVSD